MRAAARVGAAVRPAMPPPTMATGVVPGAPGGRWRAQAATPRPAMAETNCRRVSAGRSRGTSWDREDGALAPSDWRRARLMSARMSGLRAIDRTRVCHASAGGFVVREANGFVATLLLWCVDSDPREGAMSRRGRVLGGRYLVLSLLVLALAAVATPTRAQQPPIKIGVAGDLSGAAASIGQAWADAIKMGTDEINASGGI